MNQHFRLKKTPEIGSQIGVTRSLLAYEKEFQLLTESYMACFTKYLLRVSMLFMLLFGAFQEAVAQGGPGGPGGGLFTITGPTSANLNQSKTYTISGAGISSVSWIVSKGTITSSSNSSATVTWNQTGTGNIYALVTNTSNQTDPVVGVFVTITNPPPPAPAVPPAASVVALNNCGVTTISRSNPPSGVTWYWQGTSSSGTSTANSLVDYPVTTAGTYYLRARNSSGIWSINSRGISATIDPSVGSVTITGGLSSRCEGSGSTDYNASASNAAGYNWSINPSNAGSINSSGLVSWSSGFNGQATISVTATGCTPTNASKTVTITPNTGAVTISGGVNSRCEGSGTTDYNASAANANSYSWSMTPSGAGSINSSGLVTWNSSFDGTATISVTANGTCNSTNINKAISVSPQVGSVSISGGVNSRCEGSGTTDYNASAANAISYGWSMTPSNAGSINSSGLVTWNNNFIGTATVLVTANGTCGSTSSSKTVTVNNNVGPVSILGPGSRCEGSGTSSFNASAIEATGYSWSMSPSGAGSINSSGLVTWNSSFDGVATISATANGTCGSTSINKTVTVTPNVSAVSISGGVNSRCEGAGTTDFNASASGASSYSWSIVPSGAGSISGSGLVTWSGNFEGIATISATANGTCGSTNTSKAVTVSPKVGAVTISGVGSRCEGSGTTNYNANAANATSYSWSVSPTSAGSINSSGLVTWNSNFDGTATISVTASGTCGSTNASKTVVVESEVGAVSITGASNRCQGGGTSLYGGLALDVTSYGWSMSPTNAGSINSSGMVTWNSNFSGTATISVTANGTCGTSNNSKSVTVTPFVGSAAITGGINNRCEGGGTTDFNANAANASSYTWSITPSGAGSVNGSGLVTWSNNFSGTATVSVTANGCTPTNTSKAVTVTPNVGAVTISGVSSRCEGIGTTNYNANAANATSYSWSVSPTSAGSINSSGLVTWSGNFDGAATISVTASSTCGSTNTSKTVVVESEVGAVSITGASNRCQGGGTSLYGGLALDVTSYGWSMSPTNAGSINSSGMVTWNSNFSGTATISVTANGTCGTSNNSKSVTVTPFVGSAAITGGINNRCEGGGTTDFNANAANASSYTWSITPSGAGSVDGSGLVTWSNNFSGTATVSVTANGCTPTDISRAITVTPSVGAAAISGPDSHCMGGGTSTYNGSAANADSYSWSMTPSTAGSINTFGVVTWSNNFSGPATVSVTANGCSPTSTSKVVTINANVGTVSISGPDSRCEGSGTSQYDATATDASSYTWTIFPGSAGSIDQNGLVTWHNTFDGTATISATAHGTCGTSYISKFISVTAKVEAVTILDGLYDICQGTPSSDYNATALHASSYAWSIVPTTAGTIDAAGTVSWNNTFKGQATITVIASGCGSIFTSDNLVVNVLPQVGQVSLSGGLSNRWQGGGTTGFNATASDVVGYIWSVIPPEAGSIDGAGLITWNSNFHGAATVTVAATGQCGVTNSTANILVETSPLVGLSHENDVCKLGDKTTLTSLGIYDSYTWRKDGETVGTGLSIEDKGVGNYTLVVTKGGVPGSGASAVTVVTTHGGVDMGNHNYVVSTSVLTSGITNEADVDGLAVGERNVVVQYMDGLGRPVQSVSLEASPSGGHIIQPMEYDAFGRQVKQYLPYVMSNCSPYQVNPIGTGTGNYTTSPQYQFYQNATNVAHDTAPYAESFLENSPSGRVIKQGAPGAVWQPVAGSSTDHVVRMAYEMNGANEVRYFKMVENKLVSDSYYAANELTNAISGDEDGNETVQYFDKLGRVILKEVFTGDLANPWASTQYVYNNFGNLSVVLPPEANKAIADGDLANIPAGYTLVTSDLVVTPANYTGGSYMYLEGVSVTVDPLVTLSAGAQIVKYGIDIDFLDTWAFQYKYDYRQRMSEKRVPGAGWVYIVYDDLDRPLITQDANQREDGYFLSFTKYDVFSRPVMTGSWSVGREFTQQELQAIVNNRLQSSDRFESIGTGSHGYTSNALPGNFAEDDFETVTYYDDYANLPSEFSSYGYVQELGNATHYTKVKGQVVGTKTRILGTDTWLKSVVYYDDRYRVIQTISDHHLGDANRTTTKYDFAGRVLETKSLHAMPQEDINVSETFTYDHASRLMDVTHQVNSDPEVVLLKNEYNAIGELIDKKLHSTNAGSTFEQSVDYDYNIRGWLTRINDVVLGDGEGDYFGMTLTYDKATGTGNVVSYNGNISGAKWSNYSAGNGQRDAYNYSYDALNRLTSAEYRQKVPGTSWVNKTDFDVPGISYDLNGNILALSRNHKGSIHMDDLSYTYVGNQLQAVSDAGDTAEGFKDGNTTGNDYGYDANGNMISDANKDITSISYNHLNLPKTVTFTGGRSISYTYDAAGIKLTKSTNDNGTIKTTDYAAGFIYEDDVLQQFGHAEGRVRRKDDGNFVYDYYLKDHLGNTRITFTTENEQVVYLATMETDVTAEVDYGVYEESLFLNLPATRVNSPSTANSSGEAGIINDESARLRGNDPVRHIGPAKLMQVMRGDTLDLEVQAYYSSGYVDNGNIGSHILFPTIISMVSGAAPTGTEGANITNSVNGNSVSILVGGTNPTNAPRAYLNYIYFDAEFNFIDAGFTQVGTVENAHQTLTKSKVMSESGYLYVYVSNESNNSQDVYFDDLRITHTKGKVLQEDHYYPFGTNIDALSSTAPLSNPNKFKFGGKERGDEFDQNWDEYEARMYMPDLGRWGAIDIMIEKHYDSSPYAFVYNNPVRFNDQFGLDTLLVDRKGRFAKERIKGGENDIIITVSKKERKDGKLDYNKDGKLRKRHKVSKGFENGSIGITPLGDKGTAVRTTNEQSKDVFNFLADNTEVEFARFEYESFNKTFNNITTSHELRNESLGSEFVMRIVNDIKQKLIFHTHSHPINTGEPSKPGENDKGSDVGAYKSWVEKQGDSFKVYIRYNGVTRQFTTKGEVIKSDKK